MDVFSKVMASTVAIISAIVIFIVGGAIGNAFTPIVSSSAASATADASADGFSSTALLITAISYISAVILGFGGVVNLISSIRDALYW
jgi:amino acid transporter